MASLINSPFPHLGVTYGKVLSGILLNSFNLVHSRSLNLVCFSEIFFGVGLNENAIINYCTKFAMLAIKLIQQSQTQLFLS